MTQRQPIWSDEALRDLYALLVSISPKFARLASKVDVGTWMKFAHEVMAGKHPESAGSRIGLDRETSHALNSVIACMEKYDHDYEKVRDCIEGLIDP